MKSAARFLPLVRPALAWVCTMVCALACAGGAQAQTPPRAVEDPHYGDALFYFFHDRHFTALTRLMVAQHFGRVAHHADEAEILRGGLVLSYGLHREASEIFTRLIDHAASPSVRDRAWFYLAKIRYQRGLLPDAEQALARIQGPLPGALNEDRALLQASVLFARGAYAEAARVLQTVDPASEAALYARFNLGVALIKSGDVAAGSKWLDEVGRAAAANEEIRSLRDQANLALGYQALRDGQPERARASLERVRLAGMASNKALLAFGWAADALGDARQALVPWTELASRDPGDAAVLEARLAVGQAYASLGASAQALEAYETALAACESERAALDATIADVRAGPALDRLLDANPAEEMGWFASIATLPAPLSRGHLGPIVAQHRFQEGFKNYRDLGFITRNLTSWQDSLGVYDDMLANRRLAYTERLPRVRAQSGGLDAASLDARRAELAQALARAETDVEIGAFASEQERAAARRLARVRAAAQAAGDQADLVRERVRRIAGALVWQQSRVFPERLWAAKKTMREVDAGVDAARRADAALTAAQRDEPARFDAFAALIAALRARIEALLPQAAALSREQKSALQEQTVAALQERQERLSAYTTHARFAVAQIHDQANASGDSDHADDR